MRSEYMHWAKTRQSAPFNLAASGVTSVTREELGVALEDIELTGPSYYGWPPLLKEMSAHLSVPEDHIFHGEGTSGANHLTLAVTISPGDDVLVESPAYGPLADTARYLGAKVISFPRPRSADFQPDLEALKRSLTSRTRLIVVTQLHNPSSALLSDRTIRELAELAAGVGARLLVDEVYREADFESPSETAHRLDSAIVVTSSLTKVYGLSGLRCGWVLADPELVERMYRLNDLFGVIPAHPAERLSAVAFRRLPTLRERARRILEGNRAVWNRFVATRTDLEGAESRRGTVVFPRLESGDVETLCQRLRESFETTVAPGAFFGVPDSFRVGLGIPAEIFAEGVRRLGVALDQLRT